MSNQVNKQVTNRTNHQILDVRMMSFEEWKLHVPESIRKEKVIAHMQTCFLPICTFVYLSIYL